MLILAKATVSNPQVAPRICIVRLQPEGFLLCADCFLILPKITVSSPQGAPCICIVRLQPDGLLLGADCLIVFTSLIGFGSDLVPHEGLEGGAVFASSGRGVGGLAVESERPLSRQCEV